MPQTAKSPEGIFICYSGSSVAMLKWEKVNRDINQDPITIQSYYIYRTQNPSGADWGSPFAIVDTDDSYVDADVFWIDVTASNYMYKVCPFDGTTIGQCASTVGLAKTGTLAIPVTNDAWDDCDWDSGTWE
jgi:hypothetical protein